MQVTGNITNTWEGHTGLRAGAGHAQGRQQAVKCKTQLRVLAAGEDKKPLIVLINEDNCSPLNHTEFFLNYTTPKEHVIKLSSLF